MEELITDKWFATWKSFLDLDLEKLFEKVKQMELEPQSFTFYTSVSVMSSSRIEGSAWNWIAM